MKTSEVFKKAKGIVARNYVEAKWTPGEQSEREQFICIALLRLCNRKKITEVDRGRCEDIIQELIGNACTLESWLVDNGHVPDDFSWNLNSADRTRMQITRHAWLDHLIAHYQSIGD